MGIIAVHIRRRTIIDSVDKVHRVAKHILRVRRQIHSLGILQGQQFASEHIAHDTNRFHHSGGSLLVMRLDTLPVALASLRLPNYLIISVEINLEFLMITTLLLG